MPTDRDEPSKGFQFNNVQEILPLWRHRLVSTPFLKSWWHDRENGKVSDRVKKFYLPGKISNCIRIFYPDSQKNEYINLLSCFKIYRGINAFDVFHCEDFIDLGFKDKLLADQAIKHLLSFDGVTVPVIKPPDEDEKLIFLSLKDLPKNIPFESVMNEVWYGINEYGRVIGILVENNSELLANENEINLAIARNSSYTKHIPIASYLPSAPTTFFIITVAAQGSFDQGNKCLRYNTSEIFNTKGAACWGN